MISLSTNLSRWVTIVPMAMFLFVTVLAGAAWQSHAAKTGPVTIAAEAQKQDPTLVLSIGKADVVDIEGEIADILVANPDIVDVVALQANRLYIVGLTIGNTNIIIVDGNGDVVRRMNVHVKIDDVILQETVDRLFPDEDVDIFSVDQQVVMSGRVSTPEIANRVADIISMIVGDMTNMEGGADKILVNLMRVAGEQQVMLRVKILEVSREVLRELGLETDYVADTFAESLTASDADFINDTDFFTASQAGLTADPFGIGQIVYETGIGGLGSLRHIINALEEDGLLSTLAEPNLTAMSGEQASFLAGGEFPVPIGRDNDGNILIEYHPFGVSLNFIPLVMSKDRISLQLEAEVSSISNQNSLTLSGLTIPGFNVRRTSTTVELPSGGSLMIAGLLKSDTTDSWTDIPGINDIPIIGRLMASESFRREESELVIIITPVIVHPYADKERAKEIPVQRANPLARAFEANVRRIYGRLSLADDIFDYDERYGYLID